MALFCEPGNELLGFTKGEEYLGQMNECQLLKEKLVRIIPLSQRVHEQLLFLHSIEIHVKISTVTAG